MTAEASVGRFKCPSCNRTWKHRRFLHWDTEGALLHCLLCSPANCPKCTGETNHLAETATESLRWGVRHHLGGDDARNG